MRRIRLEYAALGDVAQLGERGVRNAEVEGSIPFVSTTTSSEKGRKAAWIVGFRPFLARCRPIYPIGFKAVG